ncbi:hypothetical protein [Thermococcus sp. MV11]|uniref:hypothetical protein n=1 Tax=Thermococcus sp. MV11 TaxID=1638267 RepID=UPI001F0E036E|nr:hypothetical protein [Thermococcus sp. MV11]
MGNGYGTAHLPHLSCADGLALFWPVVYGNVPVLRILPGNPLIHAVAGLVVFGGLAYLTFEEEETGEKSGFTAS